MNPLTFDFGQIALDLSDERSRAATSAREAMEMPFDEFLVWNVRVAIKRDAELRAIKEARR